MHRFSLVALFLFSVGCQPNSPLEEAKTTTTKPDASLPALEIGRGFTTEGDAAIAKPSEAPIKELAPIAVKLTAGELDSKMAPRYSPPGKGLKLEPFATPAELGFDGLKTEVVLGAPTEKQTPVKLLVTRAMAEGAYTNLYIDADGNDKFDEPAIPAKMSDSRGMSWSNFSATLKVKYLGEELVTEDYPVVFWLTVAAVADRPDVLRISRRGFKMGEATVGGTKAIVVLSDSNNDAVLGEGDWWELRSDDSPSKSSEMRRVGEFAWLGESAFKLEIDNAFGRSARLVPFDPGISRSADAQARDPFGVDRAAAKAAKPLEFRHDADAALAEAADKKMPCFIKFETTWCGPCKMMTQLVFTAKDVVEASEGVMCVMIDGDERKDLVERFEVKAYPTGVMLSADGSESGRFVGYQKVTEMTAFLKDKRVKK